MHRLFGIVCNEPKRLPEGLAPVRQSLRVGNAQRGWGLGYVEGGEVLLRKHPLATESVDFFEALSQVRSDYIIGHASDDEAPSGPPDTQPFRYKRWLYAQAGQLAHFEEIKPKLLASVPAFMQRNIGGKTAAEALFHVFLTFLQSAGVADDPNLPLSRSRRAIRDTLALVNQLHEELGLGEVDPGNIVVTNSRTMLAARISRPLHVRRLRIEERKRGKGHEFRAVLVVSDDPNPGEGFEEVPPGSVIMMTRDLQIDIVDLQA